jgi:uncharacterized membrane protein
MSRSEGEGLTWVLYGLMASGLLSWWFLFFLLPPLGAMIGAWIRMGTTQGRVHDQMRWIKNTGLWYIIWMIPIVVVAAGLVGAGAFIGGEVGALFGYSLTAPAQLILFVWVIYRIVKGMIYLHDQRAIYH